MKYLNLQSEADLINKHFANHSLVKVIADGLYTEDCGDPEEQVAVDIVAPPAPRTIEAEREREAALSAALAELETLPIVESVERIGWVYLEEGFGERYFVNIKAAPIL